MLTRGLTIFRLSLLIAVAAIDLAMLKDWYSTYRVTEFNSGFIAFEFVMFNFLAIALNRAVFSGDERRNFSRGFFLCGMIPFVAILLYTLTRTRKDVFLDVWPMLDYGPYSRRATAFLGMLGGWSASILGPMLVLLMMSAVFSIPQIAVAVFGGMANLVAWKVSERFRAKTE